jgi:hypothetical protein
LSYPFITGAIIMLAAGVANMFFLPREISPQADTSLAD